MAAVCAHRTAGVDVNRSLPIDLELEGTHEGKMSAAQFNSCHQIDFTKQILKIAVDRRHYRTLMLLRGNAVIT
jgi:hypothetical protein